MKNKINFQAAAAAHCVFILVKIVQTFNFSIWKRKSDDGEKKRSRNWIEDGKKSNSDAEKIEKHSHTHAHGGDYKYWVISDSIGWDYVIYVFGQMQSLSLSCCLTAQIHRVFNCVWRFLSIDLSRSVFQGLWVSRSLQSVFIVPSNFRVYFSLHCTQHNKMMNASHCIASHRVYIYVNCTFDNQQGSIVAAASAENILLPLCSQMQWSTP